jgi:hypothetical protein
VVTIKPSIAKARCFTAPLDGIQYNAPESRLKSCVVRELSPLCISQNTMRHPRRPTTQFMSERDMGFCPAKL